MIQQWKEIVVRTGHLETWVIDGVVRVSIAAEDGYMKWSYRVLGIINKGEERKDRLAVTCERFSANTTDC